MNTTPKLTHIALRVNNIDQSAKFYKKYANLNIVSIREEDEGIRVAWLGNSEVKETFVIVLLELPFQKSDQPSFDHLGLDVSSQAIVDQVAELARQDGILELEPKYHGPIVGYYCIIRDPDGNWVEFSYGQKIDASLESKNSQS